MIISAKKDHVNYYGHVPKVADLIGVNSQTIRRWIKYDRKEVLTKTGYTVCLQNIKL